jgi:glutathione S-transferase
MKLYYAPGACSLADHIALIESGLPFETEHVDLKAKMTAGGSDYRRINPKGYVPALELDDGEILTENVAILSYIAAESGILSPPEGIGHWRVLETVAYISSEIHKAFKPLLTPDADEDAKNQAREVLTRRLAPLADLLGDKPCLFGEHPMIADCYLFVMLMWARGKAALPLSPVLDAYFERMGQHSSVRQALEEEGVTLP